MAKKTNNYELFYNTLNSIGSEFRQSVQRSCLQSANSTFYKRLQNPQTLSEADKYFIKTKAVETIEKVVSLKSLVEQMF